jgi:hypothetical protein
MGKMRKPKGLVARLLAPLKLHRVTLTEAEKKQALLHKGKTPPKIAKKPAKKTKVKTPPAPLSMRQRQARELKTMYDIGIKDPERLAQIISKMLQDANAKNEDAQLKFERLLWEKAEKHGQKKDPREK